MLVSYRQTFFTIFAIFYIVLLPFLIILSLGYDVNFQNAKLNNTLTIKVESYPRGGNLINYDQKFQTPAELRIQDGKELFLKLETTDFFDESFRFYSKSGQNNTARVLDLWLLPKKSNTLSDFGGKIPLSILSENLVLFSRNDEVFISNYSFAGLQGEEIKVKKSSATEIKPGNWQTLLENVFWQKDLGLVLYKQSVSSWQIFDLNQFSMKFVAVAKVSETDILLLDTETNLWSLNFNSRDLNFLDSGVEGLSFTDSPDSIWLYKPSKIYRLNRSAALQDSINLENFIHTTSPSLSSLGTNSNSLSDKNFLAKSLFLGMVFNIQNSVYYIPDSNRSNVQVVSSDTLAYGGINSNLFWVDKEQNFFVYDLLLKNQRSLGKLDFKNDELENLKIVYYPKWTRVFVYSESRVYSLWYDTKILNQSILKYYSVLWLTDSSCLPLIFDSYQFCLSENKLVSYKNNSLPF